MLKKNFMFTSKPAASKHSPKTANAKGQATRTVAAPSKGKQPTAVRIAQTSAKPSIKAGSRAGNSDKQSRARPL